MPEIKYVFIALAVFSHALYVGYAAYVLASAERRKKISWDTFRRRIASMINFDVAAFVIAVIFTSGEIIFAPALFLQAIGSLLIAVGISAKYLAFREIGPRGYYWGDFFSPPAAAAPVRSGIYKYLKNPMYTIGYFQVYGWALLWLSWSGLLLAIFYHLAIFAFYFFVERDHFLETYKTS